MNRNFGSIARFERSTIIRATWWMLASIFAALAIAGVGTARASELDDDWAAIQSFLGGLKGVVTSPPQGIVNQRFTAGLLMGNGDICLLYTSRCV